MSPMTRHMTVTEVMSEDIQPSYVVVHGTAIMRHRARCSGRASARPPGRVEVEVLAHRAEAQRPGGRAELRRGPVVLHVQDGLAGGGERAQCRAFAVREALLVDREVEV